MRCEQYQAERGDPEAADAAFANFANSQHLKQVLTAATSRHCARLPLPSNSISGATYASVPAFWT